MPTLRPQRVSGLVVIPTVELASNIWTVSIAINVGASRVGAPPPEVVSREDLVVELRNPAEGSFEPIASPDPGPLPVRALRAIQARGEFTFAQGVNQPTELRVALRGDQKMFPMNQTLPRSRCLRREPREGDDFPTSRGAGGLIPPLLKPKCCVRQFKAPLNTSTDPAAKSEFFEMEASFTPSGGRCKCKCCEYRQFVRGTFSDGSGAAVRFDLPSGPLEPRDFCEDGAIDEFGQDKHGFYGHRDTSSPGDAYGGPGANDCAYRGNATPSCPPSDSVHVEFLGLIVDRCRGKVVEVRKWVVDL